MSDPHANLRLLVVDDNEPDAVLTRALLQQAHGGTSEIKVVGSIAAAAQHLATCDVDCVLLDLSLPDATGFDGLQTLRALRDELAVVVLTGQDDDEVGEFAIRLGAQDYLTKSQRSASTLRRTIRHAVERQGQRSELLAVQAALSAAHRRFQVTFDHAVVGMALLADDGHFVQVNESLSALLGYDAGTLQGMQLIALGDEDTRAELAADLEQVCSGEVCDLLVERRIVRADGTAVWLQVGLALAGGETAEQAHIVLQALDISERRHSEEGLRHQALHDPLTGLGNRALLKQRLEDALAGNGDRSGTSIGVLFIDMDDFKQVNDLYGHETGDMLLVEVAQRIRGAVRPQDTVVRLGGDEFVVLAEGLRGPQQAELVAERIRCSVAIPWSGPDGTMVPGVSVGVALATGTDATAEDLLAAADTAMYQNKQGRSRGSGTAGGLTGMAG